MAKKPVKAKSKAVVGRAKKKWSFNLSKRSALFGLVGIMAFSIVSGFGYQKWQDHQLMARAGGWTYIPFGSPGLSLYACKTSMAGGYGPVWRISMYAQNNASSGTSFKMYINRSGTVVSTGYYSLTARSAKVFTTQQYASQIYNDGVVFVNSAGASYGLAASMLANC